MNRTPLKYLLFIENVLTVFRNYSCLKRWARIIVYCWIIFNILNILVNVVANIIQATEIPIQAIQFYYYSSPCFSIYVMIASIYYSKSFNTLLLNFDAFYEIFDDEVYNQRMLREQKRLTLEIVLFFVVKITYYTYSWDYISGDKTLTLIFSTIYQYNSAVSDLRYAFQYFVLSSIFFVVSEQLGAITRSIDSELLVMKENRRNIELAENLPSVAVNHDKLNKWVKAYEYINESANLCNSMFKTQLTIMLLIVVVYYIVLMYTIALITVKGAPTFIVLFVHLFSMIVFLMALFMISRGGQKIQNSSMELQQKLCEFSLHTLENEEYYKLTKDLLRCVRTRPVRAHVFGTQNVNMSMLPSVVALFTSYTVIALQFNNVL